MKVEIIVFPGFDELDAFGPLEVLRNAAAVRSELEVRLVSASGARMTGSHGVAVDVDGGLSGDAGTLLVPGGGWNDHATVGVRAEVDNETIPGALRAAHERGATVTSVCTGGMLLAAAGLTIGRPAITHHGAVEDLRACGAIIVPARVVDDGDLVTAGGVTSGLDMALWLVERWFGAELADGVAREMEHERRGPIWLRGRDPLPDQHAVPG
jgi:transcriptional regulator GlxA family with amidase domain